jgi:hypothetical protein
MADFWVALFSAIAVPGGVANDRIPRLFGLSLAQSLAIAGVVHFGVGLVAAIVAVRKGRDWKWWVPIGLIGGTPSLVVAMMLIPSSLSPTFSQRERALEPGSPSPPGD